MGVVIGTNHQRLDPHSSQDVFVSTSNAPLGGPAATGGYATLGFNPIEVGTSLPVVAGNLATPANLVELPNTPSSFCDGEFVVNGIYVAPPTCIPRLGDAPASNYGEGYARVFAETISKLFTSNSVSEACGSPGCPWSFEFGVTTGSTVPIPGWPLGQELWAVVADGADLNGNGTSADVLNPFDLLGPPVFVSGSFTSCSSGTQVPLRSSAGNGPIDNAIAGRTLSDVMQTTGVHEFGHLAGLDHPTSSAGLTPMWEGLGPARASPFTALDYTNARLK